MTLTQLPSGLPGQAVLDCALIFLHVANHVCCWFAVERCASSASWSCTASANRGTIMTLLWHLGYFISLMTLLWHYYCTYGFYKSFTIMTHYDKIHENTIITLMTWLLWPLWQFEYIMTLIAIMTLLSPLLLSILLWHLWHSDNIICYYDICKTLFALWLLSQMS